MNSSSPLLAARPKSDACIPPPLILNSFAMAVIAPELRNVESNLNDAIQAEPFPRPCSCGAILSTSLVERSIQAYLNQSGQLGKRLAAMSIVVYVPNALGDLRSLEVLGQQFPRTLNHLDVDLKSHTAYLEWGGPGDLDGRDVAFWLPLFELMPAIDAACADRALVPVIWVGEDHAAVTAFLPTPDLVYAGVSALQTEAAHDAAATYSTEDLAHAADAASSIGSKPWLYEPWEEFENKTVVMPQMFEVGRTPR